MEATAYRNGFATGFSAGYARAHELPRRCDIGIATTPDAFSSGLVRPHRQRRWAAHNVEHADARFQYGVDYWMHRFLARRPPAPAAPPPRLLYAPIYFSFIHIFYPHMKARALRRLDPYDASRLIVPHTHPGSCDPSTRRAIRLVVDTDLCPSERFVTVPYVVSHPAWLVAFALPPTERRTLLYFRGHLPKRHLDPKQVRARLLGALRGQPGVRVAPATFPEGAAWYVDHEAYARQLLASTFCLAPRGDTASSKRTYEAIAAGCIPVIVADKLLLPFERQLDWSRLAVRFGEDEAIADPMRLLHTLRNMSSAELRARQSYLAAHRHAFLWHEDTTRLSAMHYIVHDVCAWAEL